MKIVSIKTYIIPQFKQSPKIPPIESEILGYDDEYSKSQRKIIRNHLMERILQEHSAKYHMPTKIYEQETDKYAETLLQRPRNIDYQTMRSIPATNVCSIGNNSYRGGYLPDDKSVKTAKEAGIKCVIDLTDSPEYKRRIEKGGLKYVSYSTNDNYKTIGDWDSLTLKDYYGATHRLYGSYTGTEDAFNKECRLPIENFTKLIKYLNEGYCYIGCASGTHRTDFVIMLNDAFNPKMKAGLFQYCEPAKLIACRNIYDKLTAEDKQVMGWNKDFEKMFLNKLESGFKKTLGFIPR